MNLICSNCKAKLNIPDHKISKNKESTFKCPKCSQLVHVPAVKRQKQPLSLPMDRLNALVCIDGEALKKEVYSVVKQMGFNVVAVSNTKSAMAKMEYHLYHLVIINAAFDQNKGASGIIDKMNASDMSLRRRSCLVLVTREFKTNDNMASLHSSVNTIIHQDDIPYLESFLSRALTEHKNFYTVYNESLRLAGKA